MAGHGGHGGGLHGAGGGAKGLTAAGWLTGIYFVIELGIGLWTGSIAVLSDAFHTFSAVGGVIVAILAARIARRPADAARSFGWRRAEIIGALANGAFLFIMAVVVIVMGAMRLGAPIDLPTGPMLLAAAGGLATELVSLWLLRGGAEGDLNLRGAWWHIMQTFVGSLLIIVAALVIRWTGFLAIDPILGMAFGVVLMWASVRLMREAVHVLMEGAPDDLDVAAAADDLAALPGVRDVHHVHAWALSGGVNLFSAHVRLASGREDAAGAVLADGRALLRDRHGVFFSTLQVETRCLDESAEAGLDVPPGRRGLTSGA